MVMKNSYRSKGVILLSGGLDSVTLLHHLMKYPETDLYPMFVDYGQKQLLREWAAVRYFCKKLKTREPYKVRIENHPLIASEVNYVPFRNLTLISLGCAYAQSIKGESVYIALIGTTPAKGSTGYFDSTTLFLDYVRNLVGVMTPPSKCGKDFDIEIIAPFFQARRKVDVYRMALQLGVEIGKTWSCCGSMVRKCGRCNACRDWKALEADIKKKGVRG